MATATAPGTGPLPAALGQGGIVTVAGNGQAGYQPGSRPAIETRLSSPNGVAIDKTGNLYIADRSNHCVRTVTPQGIITTVAGNGTPGSGGDGLPAATAQLNSPTDVAVDDLGNLYIADNGNHRIRTVDSAGVITTVAGSGTSGSDGDDGPATTTRINRPIGVTVDRAGNLFISEYDGHRVRKVDTDGLITTLAGTGAPGVGSDGGLATATPLRNPIGLAMGPDGSVYIADSGNNRVRRVDPQGIVTTVAGNGFPGYTGDDAPATATGLNAPWGVALDPGGNLYIADRNNHRVRMVGTDGNITTVAGDGTAEFLGEYVRAVLARLSGPSGLAIDGAGNLYIGDSGNRRVRGVSEVATMTPPPRPTADLYGDVVTSLTVPSGQGFDLGVRVKNRGPNPVDGQYVTVVLSLPKGLTGGPGIPGRRLARTFPGQQLQPQQGTLNGVFRVTVPADTQPGVYTSTLEIQYGGDLNLKDNVYTLPVTVVVPAPPTDETALSISQDTVPQAAPGESIKFNVKFDSQAGGPVDPGEIVQRFTAPTGFVFTGQPTYGYYNTIHGVVTGNLDTYRIEDGGRTLIVNADPHVNTGDRDRGPLYYTFPVAVRPDAAPGTYQDGSAGVGKHPLIPLTGTVTGSAGIETALVVSQEKVPQVAPGQSTTFNLEIRSSNDQPVDPGDIVQRLTAPTGFVFTGAASYGYYYVQPHATGNLRSSLEDNGKTLVITSNPHVNTGPKDRTALAYTIGIRALADATPGTQSDDGRAVIGRLAPVPLSARVV
ncbi:NHL repeat-containing protein [Streptomyces sp. WAC 06783]|uniref:NHL repeat-containing protein n=1 Tax=Streptomyces sp. WAC 06783 TaxID=2203211 RepID=UPI001C8B5040|nr:NHL repeat-containing protein [Streptomyces sp. WAC 06783]